MFTLDLSKPRASRATPASRRPAARRQEDEAPAPVDYMAAALAYLGLSYGSSAALAAELYGRFAGQDDFQLADAAAADQGLADNPDFSVDELAATFEQLRDSIDPADLPADVDTDIRARRPAARRSGLTNDSYLDTAVAWIAADGATADEVHDDILASFGDDDLAEDCAAELDLEGTVEGFDFDALVAAFAEMRANADTLFPREAADPAADPAATDEARSRRPASVRAMSPDELPAEVRDAYDQVTAVLADGIAKFQEWSAQRQADKEVLDQTFEQYSAALAAAGIAEADGPNPFSDPAYKGAGDWFDV